MLKKCPSQSQCIGFECNEQSISLVGYSFIMAEMCRVFQKWCKVVRMRSLLSFTFKWLRTNTSFFGLNYLLFSYNKNHEHVHNTTHWFILNSNNNLIFSFFSWFFFSIHIYKYISLKLILLVWVPVIVGINMSRFQMFRHCPTLYISAN